MKIYKYKILSIALVIAFLNFSMPDTALALRPTALANMPGADSAKMGFLTLGMPDGETTASKTSSAGSYKGYSIINPEEINTAQLLVDSVNKVITAEHAEDDKIELYEKVLYTGQAILNSYSRWLKRDDSGKVEALSRFEEFIKKSQQGSFSWNENFEEFKKLASLIPTTENPNEDLFIDVFAGLTPEQIHLIAVYGYNYTLQMVLSKGCPNQCLTCGVCKKTGALEHIPFPIAIKIMKRCYEFQKRLFPYFDSDPLSYHDMAINATFADVVRHAKRIGYQHVIFVTHGSGGGVGIRFAGDVISKTDAGARISFHIYHDPVLNYATERLKGTLAADELQRRREKIIDMYRSRFVHLIRGALSSKKTFEVTRYRPFPEAEALLEPYAFAKAAIAEIQVLQEEVWKQVWQEIGIDEYNKLEKLNLINTTYVMWVGDAAALLRNMGVPDDVIADIQMKNKSGSPTHDASIIEPDFSILVNPDGSLTMQLREGISSYARFRKISEIFDNPDSKEFRFFLELLNIISKADFYGKKEHLLGEFHNMNSVVSDVAVNDLSEDAKDMLAEKLKGCFFEQPDMAKEEILSEIRYLVVGKGIMLDYYRTLFAFFVSKSEIDPLLSNLTPENIRILWEKLKDIYFPLGIPNIDVIIGPTMYGIDFNFNNKDNPNHKRDIFHSLQLIDFKQRVFKAHEDFGLSKPLSDLKQIKEVLAGLDSSA